MSEIYAELPEDPDDIYADLEDELNKAGYNPDVLLTGPTPTPGPQLPNRNQTALPAQDSPRPVKQSLYKKNKQEKPAQNLKKANPKKQAVPAQKKPNPALMGTPLISKDMLNQRTLLKKVDRIEPRKGYDGEAKIDFRANLRKVNRDGDKINASPTKKPPPLKPKPSLTSIPLDSKNICYKRKPLTPVDLNNPPVIDREKKPRLIMDTENYDENAFEDDIYDDVTNVVADQDVYDDVDNVASQMNGGSAVEPDVYDDVENMNPDLTGECYDDVQNVAMTRDESPDLYVDVEDVGITRGKSPDLYDDVENVGITRGKSPDLYDDVDNVGITRGKSPELYDDVENVVSLAQYPKPTGEELYDEVPDTKLTVKEQPPNKKLSPAQEKKRRAEEIKFRKKQQELEKRRQKEMEKNAKELEKKRKVFYDYYNIKESDKPLTVAQVTNENDLRGKQNLEVEIGDIVHVLCKQHKKMPKGAWLAEKPDRSAIGFIAPEILNQNMIETLCSSTD